MKTESQLIAEFADAAMVTFDEGDTLHGTVERGDIVQLIRVVREDMTTPNQSPSLNAGEQHIATLTNKSGEPYHLILLDGDNDPATHADQVEWAKSIGGDLPSRVEQAMLWERARDQFQKSWYWSNETHRRESGWAWCQDFVHGGQYDYYEYGELRARAVRRLPI